MVTSIPVHSHHRPAAVRVANRTRQKPYRIHLDEHLDGFIHHPAGFPLEYRRIRTGFLSKYASARNPGTIGLCFESEKYLRPGTLLEVMIPVRGEEHKFRGRVVLIRCLDEGFEIGIWLVNREDATRIRILEQICHIESYLRHKRQQEGPFINKERIAKEWITRFAASFPSLG